MTMFLRYAAAFAAGVAAIGGPAAGTSRTTAAARVTYIPAADVRTAFIKGGPLLETDGYKVLASRRERDGQAEVHLRDTDILYVLEGTATLVTGGTAVNLKTTAVDEERGDGIGGGDVRPLVKGDVVVIPNGVPHLMKDVTAPFLYFVVKATGPRSAP